MIMGSPSQSASIGLSCAEQRFPASRASVMKMLLRWVLVIGSSLTPLPHFFRSQSIQRRCCHTKHVEVQINLSPVMDFVLSHQAQPLPERDLCSTRRKALLLYCLVCKLTENLH